MKPIIVATDFSANALNAANYAADMAMAVNGYLILLHVYQNPAPTVELPVFVDSSSMMTAAEREIRKIEEMLVHRACGKLMVESEVCMGNFYQELEALCQARMPYAVVMGSRGTSAAERFFFGSHTVHAMKHLEWPLVAVPPKVKFSSIKKIGLACDFENVIEYTPVDELACLVRDFNAELHVLNTSRQQMFDPELVFQSGMMQEILSPLEPHYHFITNDKVDESIISFAEKNEIDLLIVLPKRHGVIDRLMSKSHTKQLVLQSHIPVMALHA
jgi:nucleotide-binding universal stress UspA family protein